MRPNHVLAVVAVGSPAAIHVAERVADEAFDLAAIFDARLTLLHVALPGSTERSSAEDALLSLVLRAQEHGIRASMRVLDVGGDVSAAIVDAAADLDADVVVVGSRGNRGVKRWLLGSVAEGVVRRARVPVVVVPPFSSTSPARARADDDDADRGALRPS